MLFKFGKKRVPNITIVSFSANENYREVRNGFLKTLDDKAGGLYTYDVINGDSIPAALREKFLLRFDYNHMDIICSIGNNATQVAKEITLETSLYIPIVYGGILDSQEPDISSLPNIKEQYITGVKSTYRDYVAQVKKLLEVCPHIKSIAILKSAHHGAENEASLKKATEYLQSSKIRVKNVSIDSPSEIFCSINSLLDDTDVLLLARDTTVTSKIEGIIDVCNEKGVILFASDDISVKRGALLGYCDLERNLGIEMGNHILPLIIEDKKPWQIPSTTLPWNGDLYFNEYALNRWSASASSRHDQRGLVSI